MHTHVFPATLAAGAAALLLAGCGDLSDFPSAPVPARAAAAPTTVPSLDLPTPTPPPTADPRIAQLRAAVTRDTTVLNGDLDGLFQCEYVITDAGACRSALTGMRGQLAPMLSDLQAMHVDGDLQPAHDEMVQAITTLQAACDDDLRYLASQDSADNEKATHEFNHGFDLLDQARWDLPPGADMSEGA